MPDTGVQTELRQRIGIIHRRPVEPETMYDDFAAQQRPQGDVRLEPGTVGHRIQHRGRHHHVVDDQPQRKRQAYLAYGQAHFGIPGHVRLGLPTDKILDAGNIKQKRQDDQQNQSA